MFVYADQAATTRIDERVLSAMMPYLKDGYGNAGSLHTLGEQARQALQTARAQVAALIGADAEEIYFTSGGTESNNWVIQSVAQSFRQKGTHFICTDIEHHAVLHPFEQLQKQGYDVTYLHADAQGRVATRQLAEALRPDTVLVSVMTANNELGTIEPIESLAQIAAQHNVFFHTDAVAAVGHMPIDVRKTGVDFLSLSGHKFHAPKGVGALYVRRGLELPAWMFGGGQERGKRPGTENIPAIVGLGRAAQLARENLFENMAYISGLRDRLRQGIAARIKRSLFYTPIDGALPGILNVAFAEVSGEAVLHLLDMRGICASAGSACNARQTERSHVIQAIGASEEYADGVVRFSLDQTNTPQEVDDILHALTEIVSQLRKIS